MGARNELGFLFRSHKALWDSPRHLCFALLLVVLGGLALLLRTSWLAIAVIGLTDLYLALMLWSGAVSGFRSREPFPGLPNRRPAVVILPSVFVAFVLAFGALYANVANTFTSQIAAAYFSFVRFATFTYDPCNVTTSSCMKGIVASQLASGILLLVCAVPLLVSRLSTVDVGARTLDFNGCTVFLPDCSNVKLKVMNDSLEWERDGKTVTAIKQPSGQVDVKCARTTANVKLLVIDSDGQCHIGK